MLIKFLALISSLYLALLITLFIVQQRLVFLPSKERWADTTTPLPISSTYNTEGWQWLVTTAADGQELRHLFYPPPRKEAPVVVIFHGNAGHIGHRIGKYAFLKEAQLGIILVEYRGYGLNAGGISEEGLYADGASVLAWLGEEGFLPEKTALYGESLGTAIAVKLAFEANKQDKPYAAVVLEAPMTSIPDLAQNRYWYLPARYLSRFRFNNHTRIAALGAPLMLLHGTADRVVPYFLGKKLYEQAGPDKVMLTLEGAGHNNLLEQAETRKKVLDFITEKTKGREGTPALDFAD